MKLLVEKEEKLIKFIIHNIQGLSFGNAQKYLRLGKIKVNDTKTKDNISLKIGDIVTIDNIKKSMPKIDIIYQDDNIMIVNKPYGIECATRDKSSDNTYSLEEIFASYNARVIHRLDRLTEGLVILSRNDKTTRAFEAFFKNRLIDKYYQAGVIGKLTDNGKKTAYLYKDGKKSLVDISLTYKDGYKEIITEFNPLKIYDNCTHIDIKLHTGRTHQIRGYFSFIGHPIINDSKYGKVFNYIESEYKGYFLTAYKLIFHLSGEYEYLNKYTFEITPSWLKYLK